ncbi:MAG: hypothetical protein ACE5OZ_04250 [Candidatus Heimdallarchaeota archaeon]
MREVFPEGIIPEEEQALAGKLSNGNFIVTYIETSAKTAENVLNFLKAELKG